MNFITALLIYFGSSFQAPEVEHIQMAPLVIKASKDTPWEIAQESLRIIKKHVKDI